MTPNEASEVAKTGITQVQSPKTAFSEKSVHQNQKISSPLRRARNPSPLQKKLHPKRSKNEQVMAI